MERFAMNACLAGDLVTRLASMLHCMSQRSRQNLVALIGIVHGESPLRGYRRLEGITSALAVGKQKEH
jgi:hypothetical protein